MKLKRVEKIRDEYFDNNRTLSKKSLEELRQHLEGKDEDELCRAISLVTDARLMQFVPIMAKHLHHEDSYVRESLIGKLLGILKLPEYAEIGLKMAQEDKSGAGFLATSNIGMVMDKAPDSLKLKIAQYLYDVIMSPTYEDFYKQYAYQSIMKAMGIPPNERCGLFEKPDLQKMVKPEMIQKFKEKYGI